MNLNTSTAVQITNGVGELEFPQALKRDLLMSTICFISLYLNGNTSATNGGLFVVCDGSYYITQNGTTKKNVLAMFQNKSNGDIIHFSDHRLALNVPQDRLTIEIVNFEGSLQQVSALAVFDIAGCVSNKLLAI